MAPHSSILAWKIPWTEKPGRLQSMGLQRAGHDRACTHTMSPQHLSPASAVRSIAMGSAPLDLALYPYFTEKERL